MLEPHPFSKVCRIIRAAELLEKYGNTIMGNCKQRKWKVEMETENGKGKWSSLQNISADSHHAQGLQILHANLELWIGYG